MELNATSHYFQRITLFRDSDNATSRQTNKQARCCEEDLFAIFHCKTLQFTPRLKNLSTSSLPSLHGRIYGIVALKNSILSSSFSTTTTTTTTFQHIGSCSLHPSSEQHWKESRASTLFSIQQIGISSYAIINLMEFKINLSASSDPTSINTTAFLRCEHQTS